MTARQKPNRQKGSRPMPKLLFLLPNLDNGGAERVLVNLVNNMDCGKYDITVQTMFRGGSNAKHLNRYVRHINTGASAIRGISVIIKLLPARWLFKYFIGNSRYDIYIAYMHGAATKVLLGEKNIKKIAWLHSDVPHARLWKFLRKKSIGKALGSYNKIVGVSGAVTDAFAREYSLKEKIVTKYNTNDINRIEAMAEKPVDVEFSGQTVNLIALGKLSNVKGYERLLRVCKRLKDGGFRFKLCIFGDGTKRKILERMVKDDELAGYVGLMGYVDNPYPYLKKADVFICSSFYEGLSTILSEAVILGKTCISTNVAGAKEILGQNNEFGVVVENNENALYEGLKDFLENPEKISYYAQKARERRLFFNTEATVKAVEELIDEVAGCARDEND